MWKVGTSLPLFCNVQLSYMQNLLPIIGVSLSEPMLIITTAHVQRNFLSECVWLVFVHIHLWCTLVFIGTCIIHVGTCKIQVLIYMSEIPELVSFIYIIMQILRWNNVEPNQQRKLLSNNWIYMYFYTLFNRMFAQQAGTPHYQPGMGQAF